MMNKYKSIAAIIIASMIFSSCSESKEDDTIPPEQTAVRVDNAAENISEVQLTEQTYDLTEESVIEYRSDNFNIGEGYILFITYGSEFKNAILHISYEGTEICNMNISPEQAKDMKGNYSELYGSGVLRTDNIDVPPNFALAADRTLQYNIYFIVDGQIKEAEWYLDGEKLDSIYYDNMLWFGDGKDGFSVYTDKNTYSEGDSFYPVKLIFSIDRENARIEGHTAAEEENNFSGTEKSISGIISKYSEFYPALWNMSECDWENGIRLDDEISELYRIEKEGFRTRNELMETINEFASMDLAEKIYDKYSYVYREIDGRLYKFEPDAEYFTDYYLDSITENGNVVTARIYAELSGIDIPHTKLCLYADISTENGEWKMISMPNETP